ncbi:MAG: hypothetical protein HUU56_04810 [Bdellovibrionaceae bacterium]|nr:hypothetical protein [Pseudobdellovibrionaceae bacterium]
MSYSEVNINYYTTCGITTTGQLKCWGYGYKGELGTGLLGYILQPMMIAL